MVAMPDHYRDFQNGSYVLPEPSGEANQPAVTRARARHEQFPKSVGAKHVWDSDEAMKNLIDQLN